MNIVSIAMSLLTPAVVGRIATALGINPAMAQMAVNAALPAILAAIAHKAAHPAGLGALSGVLAQQTPGLLGNLGEVIGGAKQAQLLASGQKSLSVLFGGPPVGVLAGAVAKFAGVPEMASAGLLGLLAPVALGTIAQQQQAGGLDAAGLAQMLAGQKDALAGALPAGFGQFLVASGVLAVNRAQESGCTYCNGG